MGCLASAKLPFKIKCVCHNWIVLSKFELIQTLKTHPTEQATDATITRSKCEKPYYWTYRVQTPLLGTKYRASRLLSHDFRLFDFLPNMGGLLSHDSPCVAPVFLGQFPSTLITWT